MRMHAARAVGGEGLWLRAPVDRKPMLFYAQDSVGIVHEHDPLHELCQVCGCIEAMGYDDDAVSRVKVASRWAV